LSATFSGRYPIERRAGEIERLHIQSAAFARDVEVMLDLIGVREGWSCLDLGCGPGGITEPLSRRAGPNGRVVGLDKDAEFLEHARRRAAANIEFRQGDAYASDLPEGSFDLVHMRFLASTAGEPERDPRSDPAVPEGWSGRVAGARLRHAQVLPAASRLGQVEKRGHRSLQWHRRQCVSGPAALRHGVRARTH
jgi:SAM-dependent methyltransferase